MAEIKTYNGKPTIFIDGKPFSPMMATIRTMKNGEEIIFDKKYFENLGKAGVKIFFLICDTLWLKPNAIELFDCEARQLLAAVPDAYIIPRIGLHPPNEWIEENPDECVLYSDGTSPETELTTESYKTVMPHHYSMCSQKWRDEAGKALEETWKKLLNLEYSDRIIGCFLAAGGTSEWYYLLPIADKQKHICLDSSPAFKKEFSKYLKEIYETDESLQKHWKNPCATISNPPIPKFEKHYFSAGLDMDVAAALSEANLNNIPVSGNIGSFVDFDKNKAIYDFYRAWNIGTADSVLYFAQIIKKVSPNHLVGAFYGSQGCINFIESSSTGGNVKVLNSKFIDFLAAPGVYENRILGGFEGQRQVQDSFALHNKVYIVEQDTRTHNEDRVVRKLHGVYNLEDTKNIMKREFGRNICEDVQAWWFDQVIGGKRYKQTELYELIEQQQNIAKQAYSLNRTKKSEIAFIFDEESMQAVSFQTTKDTVELTRNYELARIGAPIDQYYHNDILDPNMPSYKMYVFLNTYVLSKDEREAIKRKLKADNAVAVWMYAPGFIEPFADNKMDTAYMRELTGMSFSMVNKCYDAVFKFEDTDHQIIENLDKTLLYGKFDRDRTLIYVKPPSALWDTYLYPLFYVNDPNATHLGYFLSSGYPSVSLKKLKDFTSVYYGSKCINCNVLRSLAKFADCHIYSDSNDVIYIGANYITFHATTSGKKIIRFPQKVTVYEVYEEKTYAKDTDVVEFDISFGETKMFFYHI